MALVYVFTRHKVTNKKKIVERMDIEDARKLCSKENENKSNNVWYEFSKYKEYAEN